MLNNFNNIYLQTCDFLKLRFTYMIDNSAETYKFDFALRLLDMNKKNSVSISDFLLSVLTNIIAPFLCLQSCSVKWNSVSIIYESNLKNQNNLLSIPLKNVRGQIPISEEANTQLKVSLRFENSPRPTVIKIYGLPTITQEDENTVEKNLKACEKAFVDIFEVENTPVKYRYIHNQTQSFLVKEKKRKNSLKLKPKLNTVSIHRIPFLAITYI